MLDVIQKKIDCLRRLEDAINVAIMNIVRRNEGFIVRLNKEQLESGMNADGVQLNIRNPYTAFTRAYKGSSTVDLLDEGDFHESFVIEYEYDEFYIYAKDIKVNVLTVKYGSEIFGLTEESLSKLKVIIQKELADEIRDT